jgi:cytoskeletal protein RodZ
MLKRAREHRGLTLEKIANQTKIPQRHLEALEHDDLTLVSSDFYRRAEIRAYAQAVGLDQTKALALLEPEPEPVQLERQEEREKEIEKSPKVTSPRTYGLIALAVIGITATASLLINYERPPAPPQATATQSIAPAPSAQISQRGFSTPSDTASVEPISSTAVSNPVDVLMPQQTETPSSGNSVGVLVVTTEPAGARVTVNGIAWGISPVTIRHLPPGEKRVRVSKEGYAAQERVLTLGEGRQRELDIRLDSAQ